MPGAGTEAKKTGGDSARGLTETEMVQSPSTTGAHWLFNSDVGFLCGRAGQQKLPQVRMSVTAISNGDGQRGGQNRQTGPVLVRVHNPLKV